MQSDRNPAPRAPLEIWLFNNRKTPTEFAREHGISQSVLSKALMPPTAEHFKEATIRLRKLVRRATDGAIGLTDWPEAPETQCPTAAPPPRVAEPAPCSSGAG